jgi:alkylation response protein AidB-like acyl-CoA dehydrogenase
MQKFPWWTDAQKKLSDEVKEFTDRLIPLATELAYKKKFPFPAMKEIAKKGYFGAMIPKKYGGHLEDWGVTGACIIVEELGRAGEVWAPFTSTMVGSVHQILHFGTEEQKERWLVPLAKGEYLGAITITEPFVGSDASNIRTKARLDGDHYVINGKKRYIGQAGAAQTYMAYVATSDRPEDKAKYRHLTALVIEKGTPGFTVERVVDLVALDGNYMGYLNFDNVRVPVANRLGKEGDAWMVMTSGLNAERVIAGAQWLGAMRESTRYAVYHMERRLQFGKPTMDISVNQFKVAEMIKKLTLARTFTYYTAYLIDQGQETPFESAMVKLFNADSSMEVALEAIQCMGGDGLTHSYPPARAMRDAKVAQIVAGTQEINRLVIYRQGMRVLGDEMQVPPYAFNEELNIPMPSNEIPPKQKGTDAILKVMAEYYRVHPGLHMSHKELAAGLDMTEAEMDKELLELEKQGLVDLYRDRKGKVALARSTYEGLAAVHPPEYYRSIPSWVDKTELF